MRPFILTFAFIAAPMAALADDSPIDRGLSLLEEGAGLMIEGLLSEIGPRLAELEEAIGELNAYHPPEVLPNGDIIIRRRTPLPTPLDEGEIEL